MGFENSQPYNQRTVLTREFVTQGWWVLKVSQGKGKCGQLSCDSTGLSPSDLLSVCLLGSCAASSSGQWTHHGAFLPEPALCNQGFHSCFQFPTSCCLFYTLPLAQVTPSTFSPQPPGLLHNMSLASLFFNKMVAQRFVAAFLRFFLQSLEKIHMGNCPPSIFFMFRQKISRWLCLLFCFFLTRKQKVWENGSSSCWLFVIVVVYFQCWGCTPMPDACALPLNNTPSATPSLWLPLIFIVLV